MFVRFLNTPLKFPLPLLKNIDMTKEFFFFSAYNLNVNTCTDKSPHCKTWFKEGKCVAAQDEMEAYCPSMCGLCKFN